MSRRQGEGGYVQRMEVKVKRKKVRGGGGFRVDVNGEVKLLWKFKKNGGGGSDWAGGGGGGGGGVGSGGGRVGGSGWMGMEK